MKLEVRHTNTIPKTIDSYPSGLAALMDLGVCNPDFLVGWAAGSTVEPRVTWDDMNYVRLGDAAKLMAPCYGKWDEESWATLLRAYQEAHKLLAGKHFNNTGEPVSKAEHEGGAYLEFIQVFGLAQVVKEGTNHFKATPALVEKMALTRTEVGWDDLHLPYSAFVLELPPKLFRVTQPEGTVSLTTVVVFQPPPGAVARLAILIKGFATVEGSNVEASHSYFLEEANTVYGSIEDTVQRTQGIETLGVDGAEGQAACIKLLQTISNLLLYLSSSPHKERHQPPGIKSARKRANRLTGAARQAAIKRLEELRDLGSPYVIGSKVVIDKELSQAAGEAASGRKISTASYVRGHLRKQAHGPGRSLRKIIWIEPHWRGLEAEKVSEKEFEVR